MKTQTIDGKLLFAQNAITNSINIPEIQQVLSGSGYDATKLGEGKALHDNAAVLQIKHKKEHGEQFEATDAMHLAKAVVNKTYMKHVKLARIALKSERGSWESLQLTGDRKDSFSGWLKQADTFYTNALNTPEVLTKLAKLGISKKVLTTTQALVDDVGAKYNAQLKEKGEAQTARQQRDFAMDELQEWMSDFIKVARIALEEQAQYLEMLGIVVPS